MLNRTKFIRRTATPCRLYQTPATPALLVPVAHAISCPCSATKHKLFVAFPLRHEPIPVYALLGVPHIGMISLSYAWKSIALLMMWPTFAFSVLMSALMSDFQDCTLWGARISAPTGVRLCGAQQDDRELAAFLRT
jgi:hypothetical protein